MDYKLIIANAIEEFKTQKTPYSVFFKRAAKEAHNTEFDDFIDGCIRVITLYKNHIEELFLNSYKEHDWALLSYKQLIINGETKEQDRQAYQEHIDRIESERSKIKNKGCKTNKDYICDLTYFGEITDQPLMSKHVLDYSDLQELENVIKSLNFKPEKKENNKNEPEFISYLQHPNKKALNNKLHELLDNSEGKPVAITIKALIKCSFLTGYKSNEQLFRAMRKEFGEIGASSGINSFLNENGKKLDDNDITTTLEILLRVK